MNSGKGLLCCTVTNTVQLPKEKTVLPHKGYKTVTIRSEILDMLACAVKEKLYPSMSDAAEDSVKRNEVITKGVKPA